jgi:thymidylate kinase
LEKRDYKTLSCEGGDQVGKGDALNFLLEKLVEEEGADVVTTSFPIYATPIGNTIRAFLKEGGEKFGLTSTEELEVKMSLFALNRLEFLYVFLSEDVDEDVLILLDRSAFSNALTIAYAMKKIPDIDDSKVRELVKTAMSLDNLLIETLNLKNCVVCLTSNGGVWENARGGEVDLHEDSEVQEYADYVYSIYGEIVGEGWKAVVTRENGEWEEREAIFQQIREFIKQRFGDISRREDGGRRVDIGIREIMDGIYSGSSVEDGILEDYVDSVRNNDKDAMYMTAQMVSEQVCGSYTEIQFKDNSVKKAFAEILSRYPKILEVLEYNLGEEFVFKLISGLKNEEE